MLGHIKHLQLSESDCDFQSSNPRAKMQNNGYVPLFFFLSFIKSSSRFSLFSLLISVVPHSVPYLQIPHLLLGAYILNDKWADFFVYRLRKISVQIWTPLIVVLVKFCGTTIWPTLYSPCLILSFRIFITCWVDCRTSKDISLQFGIVNLNLEKI